MEQKSNNILILIPKKTNRLVYIINHFCIEQLGIKANYTTEKEVFEAHDGAKFHYGFTSIGAEVFIAAEQLLFERGIQDQEINYGEYQNLPTLFPTYNRDSVYLFDIFAASFYLMSRYEEYLPFIKDRYGRFSADKSIAHQKGFLQKPLIDIWARDFAEKLLEKFPELEITQPSYKFIPSIDIDAAYAIKNKGALRTIGGYLKSFRNMDFKEVSHRNRVLRGKETDPFDTFDFLFDIHHKYELKPLFFILFADYGTNDKNTPTYNRKFKELVAYIADNSTIGVHPSYTSNSVSGKLKKEISKLSKTIHDEITRSRQHFLILHLPSTYRNLLNNSITDDYSMGYAGQIGFRASTSRSFLFYDLEMEYTTSLRIHPFTAMEGTLRDYQNLNTEEAYNALKNIIDELKNIGGTYISLWHNESMSNQNRWVGWRDLYVKMIEYALPNKTEK